MSAYKYFKVGLASFCIFLGEKILWAMANMFEQRLLRKPNVTGIEKILFGLGKIIPEFNIYPKWKR